jgi:hypothetical protein
MKRMRIVMLLLMSAACLQCLVSAGSAAQKKLWVTSKDVKLKKDKSSSSPTVAVLSLGTTLTSGEYENRWYKVTTEDGQAGWVYRGKVSDTAPDLSEEDEDGFLDNLPGTTISADKADTSRSIRGLSPESQEYAKSSEVPEECREQLKKLLNIKIPTGEVESFLKSGKIGEHAQ